MLILKKPIQLNSLKPLWIMNSSFSEKIAANYQFFLLDICAQDLLHLASLTPQEYQEEVGNLSLTLNFNRKDSGQSKIKMLNNWFNRILQLGTVHFTYQDEVYITQVLRKMGVTQTAAFMNRVQELYKADEITGSIIRGCSEIAGELRKTVQNISAVNTIRDSAATARYYMQEEIFRHLETNEMTHVVYEYHKSMQNMYGFITQEEILLAEHLKMAGMIQTAQLRSLAASVFYRAVRSYPNYYENYVIPQAIMNEKEIVTQMVSAALLYLTDMLHTNAAQSIYTNQYSAARTWIHCQSSVYHSLANMFMRFREKHVHTDRTLQEEYINIGESQYRESSSRLYAYEEQLIRLFTGQSQVDTPALIQKREETASLILQTAQELSDAQLERGGGITEFIHNELCRIAKIQSAVYENHSIEQAADQKAAGVEQSLVFEDRMPESKISNIDILQEQEQIENIKNQTYVQEQIENIKNHTYEQAQIENIKNHTYEQEQIENIKNHTYEQEQIENIKNHTYEQAQIENIKNHTYVQEQSEKDIAREEAAVFNEISGQELVNRANVREQTDTDVNESVEQIIIHKDNLLESEAGGYSNTLLEKVSAYRFTEQKQELPYREVTQEQFRVQSKAEELEEEQTQIHQEQTQIHQEQAQIYQEQTQIYQEQQDVQMKQFLDSVNEKNIRLQQELRKQELSKESIQQIKVDKGAVIRNSIRILENPEEVLAEMMEKTVPVQSNGKLSAQSLILQEKEQLTVDEDYQIKINQIELQRAIQKINQISPQSPPLEADEAGREKIYFKTSNTGELSLIHKKTFHEIEEDYTEQLWQKRTDIKKQEKSIEKSIENHIKENMTQQVTHTVLEELKKEFRHTGETVIPNLIEQNMQTQTTAISEIVYRKLERKLIEERKRRGY